MKTLILTLAFGLLVLSSAGNAEETASLNTEEAVDFQGILSLAKMTGMCGIFSQMTRFQETTKMPGGDEFILWFMATESARLGKTAVGFAERCDRITKIYGAYWEAAGGDAQQ